MEQKRAPIWEKLLKWQQKEHLWLHVPAHGGGAGLPLELQKYFGNYASFDLTELPGLDNLHEPRGIIAEAQALTAQLFGAKASFFLAGGASAGVRAMIRACCNPGDTILVARNAHKSLYEALVFTGVIPRYLPVEIVDGFPLNITAEAVKEGFARYPEAKVLFITSPSYYGVTADLPSIAEEVRKAGALLLVDEAHGAHLEFCGQLPAAAGPYCDLRVQSWHKTLGTLTPGAVLHCQTERIAENRLPLALRDVQTTSPPYPLLASLDLTRRAMALKGEEITAKMLVNAEKLRHALAAYFPLLQRQQVRSLGFDLDETRVTMLVGKAGICGLTAGRKLAGFGIDLEIIQADTLLAVIGPGYTFSWDERIASVLKAIPRRTRSFRPMQAIPAIPEMVLTPREAYFRPATKVKLQAAVDSTAWEMIVSYPPGIPLVLPGEKLTSEVIAYLQEARHLGVDFMGIDSTGQVLVCK